MKPVISATLKGTPLRQTVLFEPSSFEIGKPLRVVHVLNKTESDEKGKGKNHKLQLHHIGETEPLKRLQRVFACVIILERQPFMTHLVSIG